jgi:hypothetical protein
MSPVVALLLSSFMPLHEEKDLYVGMKKRGVSVMENNLRNPFFLAWTFISMESDPTGTLTVGQRERRFSVNKHLDSLTAVLKGEVKNRRKTAATREVENQVQS